MKAALEKLTAVGGELYAEAQKAATPAPGAPPPPADGGAAKKPEKKADVVDADFEVVDEDKKK
jgi:molecular chaperone DnaK